MTASFRGFLPDGTRAEAIDGAVRGAFADSLAAALAPFAAQGAIAPAEVAAVSAALRAGRAGPGIVAAYVDLVEATFRDAPDDAGAALAVLRAAPPAPAESLACVTLDDRDLGPGQAARYARILADDPAAPIAVVPVDAAAKVRAAAMVADGLALLDRALPDAAAELRALVRQIVLVESPADAAVGFAGASSFHLWGALFLNAASLVDRRATVEALIHEGAHSLLFGRAMGRRVVEGPDEPRHASPLRDDPRPMDGIAHATFVLARMTWAMRALAESGLLDAEERRAAQAAEAGHRRRFAEGWAELAAHGRLTPVGAASLGEARAWIEATAG